MSGRQLGYKLGRFCFNIQLIARKQSKLPQAWQNLGRKGESQMLPISLIPIWSYPEKCDRVPFMTTNLFYPLSTITVGNFFVRTSYTNGLVISFRIFHQSGIPLMCGGYSRAPHDSEHCYRYDPGNWEIKSDLEVLNNLGCHIVYLRS